MRILADDVLYTYLNGVGLTSASPTLTMIDANKVGYDWVKVEYSPSGFAAGVAIIVTFTDVITGNVSKEIIYANIPVTRYYKLDAKLGLGASLSFNAAGLPAATTIYAYATLLKGEIRPIQ